MIGNATEDRNRGRISDVPRTAIIVVAQPLVQTVAG